MTASVAIAALAFALAGWLGARIARTICLDRVPFDDGPAAIHTKPWMFAVAAGIAGGGAALHQAPLQLAVLGLVTIALAACAASDFTCGIVPDIFTLGPLAALVLAGALRADLTPLGSAAIVALPFGAAALLSHGRGMGWGDVKVAALGGALIGARGATLAFVFACFAAFVVGRFIAKRGKPVAFAPYLIAAIGAEVCLASGA
ncbi:MAG: hypothetical protein NVSMB5_04070 [Candidatus Velthaea sp.]